MYLYASGCMKDQLKILLPILFMAFLITSCDPGRVYDESLHIAGASWHQDSVCHYAVSIDDSTALNDLYISIRNNTDYQYSNLYLFVTTVFPNGHSTRDTIEFILADKQGKWLGSGSGKIRDNLIMLQKNLRFPLRGEYHFYLQQGMRHERLNGIEDIGMRIERSDN